MRLKWFWMFTAVFVIAALYYSGDAGATAASGFSATTLAQGRFGEIEVFNKSIKPSSGADGEQADVWLSLQKTKGSSDLYVQSNVWQPGGSTGWHTHPGHSLIIVTEGTLTEYDSDDPNCTPHVYTAAPGQPNVGFVDHGGDHAHMIRNEGTVLAKTTAVQLIPTGATRRIDVAAPGNCPI